MEDILEATLSQESVTTLYHYTTQAGLLGIIRERVIWASHTQYLNDAREYQHAIDVVRAEISDRLSVADAGKGRILKDMEAGLNGISSTNVCVCSFSEDRDSLSQWRAYGGANGGYSIGFQPKGLLGMVRRQEFFLAPCIYDAAKQRTLMGALVDKVLAENVKRLSQGEVLVEEGMESLLEWSAKLLLPRGGNLVPYLHRFAPILKDQSFAEEKEWRVISSPLACTREGFGYRLGVSMPIPYYRTPIADAGQHLALDEVVVGPIPHMELSRRAVQSFLVSQDLFSVRVEASAVPYRNW